MHRRVARDATSLRTGDSTLEIGAGTLNHLEYEPNSNPYDIVEPFVDLYQDSLVRSRIRNSYTSVHEIARVTYDRIISIAAFEHMCDLPAVVARSGLLLRPAGHLRVAVPSEGTLLWTLGWMMTTGIEFRLRHGLNYGVLMRHEHVNTADEISAVLHVFFKSVARSVFGLSPALSFYQFFECATPDQSCCSEYLKSLDLMT